jgi:hypothetical protein
MNPRAYLLLYLGIVARASCHGMVDVEALGLHKAMVTTERKEEKQVAVRSFMTMSPAPMCIVPENLPLRRLGRRGSAGFDDVDDNRLI